MEEIYQLLIICPLILIASMIDAISGSGSIISFPTYLVVGIPVHYAYGTQKFVAFWGMLVSALRYIKNKKYELKLVMTFSILCMLGTYIGSKLLLAINEKYLRYGLLFLIATVFIFSIIKKYKPAKRKNTIEKEETKTAKFIKSLTPRKKLVLNVLIGLIFGLYAGTIGVGATSILILIFIKLFNTNSVIAAGNARIINCLLNLVAMITFLLDKKIMFAIAIPATISSMIGNYIGAGLAMKKANKLIEPLLKIIFLVLLVELIIQSIF